MKILSAVLFAAGALSLAACAHPAQLETLTIKGDGINMTAYSAATTAKVEADGTVVLEAR